MRIAQISPLAEAVPPKLYGGTERVVSWLTEELVRQGHEVRLFASGDSQTSAKLEAGCPQGLRLLGVRDHTAHNLVMLDRVRKRADEFDIIHCHIDVLQYPMFQDMADKLVTTLHGRLDLPDYFPVFEEYQNMPLISISDSQREPMVPGVNWVSTVYHGLPPDVATFNPKGGDYLAFLGRISAEKRPDRAIEIARRAGKKIKIAAKIDRADQEYFDEEIKHLFEQPHVEYIGEIDERQKIDFLGNAAALLFPIDWREPFGLVMIEAMSSGTPVVAWRNGSVPEVIEHGVGGVIVDSMDAAVAGVDEVLGYDRAKVRAYFESRFTAEKMASGYIDAYNKVIESGARGPRLVAAE